MAASTVPWLGPRIRRERARRGMSLRRLAREVGVSASMISQIETAKSQPSVSTLYAITNALGMSIEDLFAVSDESAVSTGSAARGARGALPTVVEALGSFAPDRLGPLVRPAQRQRLELDSGVTWELLGKLPQHAVDFLLITYAPGGTSSSSGGLMRHPGSEYGFLLNGGLVATVGFETFRLGAGDALSFDSTTPHGYRNEGDVPAVGIWFVTESGR